MLWSFLFNLASGFMFVIDKVTPDLELPQGFYDILEQTVNFALQLNGIFPVEALFQVIGIYFLIILAGGIAKVATFLINIIRGSGTQSPV